MKTRTMARLTRTATPHTNWCARDHTCGIDTHRARPVGRIDLAEVSR